MGFFSRKNRSSKASTTSTSGGDGDQPSLTRTGRTRTSIQSHASSSLQQKYTLNNRNPNGSTLMGAGGGAKCPSPLSAPSMPKVDLPPPPDPQLDPVGYLRSLQSVRERCMLLTTKAIRNDLKHFDVDMTKFEDVVMFVSQIIKRDYDPPFTSVPPHGRYQHFCIGGRDRIAHLLSTFGSSIDPTETCRRLIDLFLVSVLLDAGAGTTWVYKSAENGRIFRRSEGLAIASLEMFKSVDKKGLQALTLEAVARGLQASDTNRLAGLEGRTNVLIRLGIALDQFPQYFGPDGRPGNMLDYLLSHPSTQVSSTPVILIPVLWEVLMTGLAPVWPSSRTAINGVSIGDAWPCSSMPQAQQTSPTSPNLSPFPHSSTLGTNGTSENGMAAASAVKSTPSSPQTLGRAAQWECILPFHKLTQWLTYSLMQPMQSLLRIQFAGTELLTGLPEYRNGGLFVDLGVLTLRKPDEERGLNHYQEYCKRNGTVPVEVAPMFMPDDDVVVEWRGVTVGFLDRLCAEVNKALRKDLQGHELSLPQLLEAGSWKIGVLHEIRIRESDAFGAINIIFLGDFAQLPPVMAQPLYAPEPSSDSDLAGKNQYLQFIMTIRLTDETVHLYCRRAVTALVSLKDDLIRWPEPGTADYASVKTQICSGAREYFQDCMGFLDGSTMILRYRLLWHGDDYLTRKNNYEIIATAVYTWYRRFIFLAAGMAGINP